MPSAVIPYTVCNTDIELKVQYSYTKGAAPRWSDLDGGDPGYGPEVDIEKICWDVNGRWEGLPAKLFDQIAGDEYVYLKLCEAEENRED